MVRGEEVLIEVLNALQKCTARILDSGFRIAEPRTQTVERTPASLTIRSMILIRAEGNASYLTSPPLEHLRPSPMASRADAERPSTVRRYFSAMGRSAGWMRSHQRQIDSCISASVFSPETRASINR